MQHRRGDNYVGAMAFSLVDSFFAAAEESDLCSVFQKHLNYGEAYSACSYGYDGCFSFKDMKFLPAFLGQDICTKKYIVSL